MFGISIFCITKHVFFILAFLYDYIGLDRSGKKKKKGYQTSPKLKVWIFSDGGQKSRQQMEDIRIEPYELSD